MTNHEKTNEWLGWERVHLFVLYTTCSSMLSVFLKRQELHKDFAHAVIKDGPSRCDPRPLVFMCSWVGI